jgi:hypothetical protein
VSQQLVFCTFRQPGFHRWEGAPERYEYLASWHRHEFHVRVEVIVNHSNRDLEFIHLKQVARCAFGRMGSKEESYDGHLMYGSKSCEMLALELGERLRADGITAYAIEVSEDGENGAKVIL